jgi:hypothetical protein
MERQVSAYRRLLRLSRSKQEALVDWDVADLRRVVIEEQIVLAQALEYEQEYAVACAGVARDLAPGVETSVGDIVPLLPPDLRERAVKARADLSSLAEQLLLLTRANAELIQRGRQFVEAFIAQIGRIVGNPTYDGSGSVAPVSRNISATTLSRRL